MAEEKNPSVLGKVGKDLLKAFNTGFRTLFLLS